MIVKVTKKHIEKGKRKNCYACPVALALIDAGFKKVDVDTYLYVYHGVRDWQQLPANASRFIERFDDGKPVKPFSFRVRKLRVQS